MCVTVDMKYMLELFSERGVHYISLIVSWTDWVIMFISQIKYKINTGYITYQKQHQHRKLSLNSIEEILNSYRKINEN